MKNALVGGGTAATTTATGLAEITEMIPDDIGKLACLVGIVASVVVIVTQCVMTRLNAKKTELEIQQIKAGLGK